MSDVIDQAQEREQNLRDEALARYRKLHAASSNATPEPRDCAACGDAIPAERLAAVPDTRHCVDCVPKPARRR